MTDDFRVEMIGHATLRIRSGGRTLLTDPWTIDPIGCNSAFHFPPLVHDAATLAADTDAIYISHIHPDHFNPPTLEAFPRHVPIYIGCYRRKRFRDEVRALGFPVIEVPFQTLVPVEGTDFEIAIVEHDYEESAAYDSALFVRTPAFTLFENNDCFLRPEKYRWVREHCRVDYGFLGYSPASFFPICFEMDETERGRLLREAADRRYNDFLEAAAILRPALTIPFASGARFLFPNALWKNVAFNSPSEAVHRLSALDLAGDVMGPGDRILADGSLRRVAPVLEGEEFLQAIAAYGHSVADWLDQIAADEPPARPDIVEQFRDYILGLWRELQDRLPGVRRHVIAYRLLGPEEKRFHFDFSRPMDEVFQWGEPERYDMRYTYPAGGLQERLDGKIDWDELHFTNDVSVHQVIYARDFYMMLRSEMLELDRGPAGAYAEPGAASGSRSSSSRSS